MGGDGARGNVLNHHGMINYVDRAYSETMPEGCPEKFRVQDRASTFVGTRVIFSCCLRGTLGRGEVLVLSVPVPTVD